MEFVLLFVLLSQTGGSWGAGNAPVPEVSVVVQPQSWAGVAEWGILAFETH